MITSLHIVSAYNLVRPSSAKQKTEHKKVINRETL